MAPPGACECAVPAPGAQACRAPAAPSCTSRAPSQSSAQPCSHPRRPARQGRRARGLIKGDQLNETARPAEAFRMRLNDRHSQEQRVSCDSVRLISWRRSGQGSGLPTLRGTCTLRASAGAASTRWCRRCCMRRAVRGMSPVSPGAGRQPQPPAGRGRGGALGRIEPMVWGQPGAPAVGHPRRAILRQPTRGL